MSTGQNDFAKKLNFISIIKNHRKYEDMYKTIEGKVAILGSGCIGVFFYEYLFCIDVEEFNELLKDIVFVFVPSLLGLLGIIFAGLAFASGTISIKATENLFVEDKIDHLIGIFGSFYFAGWTIGVTIILYIVMFFMALSSLVIIPLLSSLFAFVVGYFTLFIIFYTVGLFDTCIKLFFVNYMYNKNK